MKCLLTFSLFSVIFLFYLSLSIFRAIYNFAKADPEIYSVLVKDIVLLREIKQKYLTVIDTRTIRDEINFHCCIHKDVRIGQKVLISFDKDNGWFIYSKPGVLNTSK